MKFNKVFFLVFTSMLLASCAHFQGHIQSSAAITNGDFTIVGKARGSSEGKYLFGIGGMRHSGMVSEAKVDMEQKYPLAKAQVYANLALDVKKSYYLLYSKVTTTVSADIVQFGSVETSSITKPVSDSGTVSASPSAPILNVQEITFDPKEQVMVRTGVHNFEQMTIQKIRNGKYQFDKVKTGNSPYIKPKGSLYKQKGTYLVDASHTMTIGDIVRITYLDPESYSTVTVVGMGSKRFLARLKDSKGKELIRAISYAKIHF